MQQFVAGQELGAASLSATERAGSCAVHMRKTVITDKGKGWAGVTIRDPGLDALTETFMRATRWRGPCELEVIQQYVTNQ